MAKKLPYELALLNEWAERLGLQDWAIVLKTECNPLEMSIPDSVGCTSWQESTKTAMIQIADPKKIEMLTRPFDLEEILVHELLHLKLSLLSSLDEKETLADRLIHQIIDDLSRAFVDAKDAGRLEDKTKER